MFSSLPVCRYDVPTNPQRVLAGVVRDESAVSRYNNLTISIISLISYGGSTVLYAMSPPAVNRNYPQLPQAGFTASIKLPDRRIAGPQDRWITGSLDRWITGSLDRWNLCRLIPKKDIKPNIFTVGTRR